MPRVLALTLLAIAVVRLLGVTPGAVGRNDFAHYYLGARMVAAGEDPYTTPLRPLMEQRGFAYDERIPHAAHPPLLLRAFTLVSWLPPETAYAVWLACQFGLLAALGVFVWRALAPALSGVWALAAVALALNSTTVLRHTYYSQVQVLVAVLIAAAWAAKSRERGAAGAALVAAAAAFKLYPAALVPWFVLSGVGGWRGAARRALAAAGVFAAAVAVTGPHAWVGFVLDGMPVIQRSVGSSLTNYSLPSALLVFGDTLAGAGIAQRSEHALKLLGRLASIVVIAAAYLAIWRWRLKDEAALGLLTVAMLVASPVCWSHYFVLMILPACWLARGAWATADPRFGVAAAIVALGCLMPELDAGVPLGDGGAARMALHFYPLYALTLAAMLFVTLGRRKQALAPAAV